MSVFVYLFILSLNCLFLFLDMYSLSSLLVLYHNIFIVFLNGYIPNLVELSPMEMLEIHYLFTVLVNVSSSKSNALMCYVCSSFTLSLLVFQLSHICHLFLFPHESILFLSLTDGYGLDHLQHPSGPPPEPTLSSQ